MMLMKNIIIAITTCFSATFFGLQENNTFMNSHSQNNKVNSFHDKIQCFIACFLVCRLPGVAGGLLRIPGLK